MQSALGPGCRRALRPSGIYYYEWKNDGLRLVKLKPVGSYPDASATRITPAMFDLGVRSTVNR